MSQNNNNQSIAEISEYQLQLIEQLGSAKSNNTTLITYYLKGGSPLSVASSKISSELRTCQNIKSKQTSNATKTSLKAIQHRLKKYKRVPDNGIAIFSGIECYV